VEWGPLGMSSPPETERLSSSWEREGDRKGCRLPQRPSPTPPLRGARRLPIYVGQVLRLPSSLNLAYLEFSKRKADRQLLVAAIDFYGNNITRVLVQQGISER
jgi:hypothetical protein